MQNNSLIFFIEFTTDRFIILIIKDIYLKHLTMRFTGTNYFYCLKRLIVCRKKAGNGLASVC
jgi:hypothetical protein